MTLKEWLIKEWPTNEFIESEPELYTQKSYINVLLKNLNVNINESYEVGEKNYINCPLNRKFVFSWCRLDNNLIVAYIETPSNIYFTFGKVKNVN